MLSIASEQRQRFLLKLRRKGRSKMVVKKASKKPTKKSVRKTVQVGKKRATDKAASVRTAKVQRGTSGTGPRIASTAGRTKKAKEKPCD